MRSTQTVLRKEIAKKMTWRECQSFCSMFRAFLLMRWWFLMVWINIINWGVHIWFHVCMHKQSLYHLLRNDSSDLCGFPILFDELYICYSLHLGGIITYSSSLPEYFFCISPPSQWFTYHTNDQLMKPIYTEYSFGKIIVAGHTGYWLIHWVPRFWNHAFSDFLLER